MKKNEREPSGSQKNEMAWWGMTVASVVLAVASFKIGEEADRLEREEIVWFTNVPAEQMDQRLREANQERMLVSQLTFATAGLSMIAAWGSHLRARTVDKD